MYERSYSKTVLKHDDAPKRKVFPWKRVIGITATCALLTGVVFLIRAPRLQIRTVEVTGTHVADPLEVSQFVLSEIAGNYLWILPKSSIVLVSPETIEMRIREHFPRFKSVSVERTSVHTFSVVANEYEGVYLWCDDECSFMDEQGLVFADAPFFSGYAYLKVYANERQSFPFKGLSDEQLSLVKTLNDKLQGISINPVEFRFVDDHNISIAFPRTTLQDSYEAHIFFDPTTNLDNALETLYTGLRTDPLMRLYHDKTQILEYLDVRFGGKVVYKFR